ncbi:MAG: phage tail protein I [Paracoccus sp. (in: a-proteobacteria)]|uniref:phage tail protein I n=1 Tax=Paracoccus sp. TaxID=267 RepID=UPI0026DF4086|nr:phage tail protein I [Paracoccus sp. (in: a-proteobacteria)]MDO5631140.1 phage tail protein I [Paracoccus sp. (in: a-proteobacteria)]
MTSLLPPNSTATERAAEAVTDRPVPVPVADLWSADRCPAAHLPWLAWALSVDDWDPDWPEDTQRAVIAASVEVHRCKGTVWAMRRALAVAGLGDATIQEGWSANRYDGVVPRNGSRTRKTSDHWAEYRVTLTRPMAIRQASRARAILTAAAPTRCHLTQMSYAQAAHLYNGTVPRGGQYTRGIV